LTDSQPNAASPIMIEVTTTVPSLEDAERIAQRSVQLHLAACVQILGPVRSIYRWEGKIELGTEWRLVIKTSAARRTDVLHWLRTEHPYQVPELAVHDVAWVDSEYGKWVEAQTTPPGE